DERDLVRNGVHRVPRRAVVLRLRAARKVLRAGLGIAEMDHGLWAREVGLRRREIDKAVRIARGHIADAADSDDDGVVVGAKHVLQMFESRDLFEKLGLRVAAKFAESGCCDLEMECVAIGSLA